MSIKIRTIVGMILGAIICAYSIIFRKDNSLITFIIGGLFILVSIILEPTEREEEDDNKGHNNKDE
jgi:predicted ABC-type sugar transport system permease subunit